MDLSSRIHIAAPPERVWATVVDLRHLVDDIPGVVAVAPADFTATQGQRVTVTVEASGRRLDVPATLTTVAPPTRLVVDAELPDPVGAPATATLALAPSGGGTDVALQVALKLGMLKEMAAKAMLGGRGQAALDDALAQLKRRVEGA